MGIRANVPGDVTIGRPAPTPAPAPVKSTYMPMAPVIDIGARVATANAASELARKRAAGSGASSTKLGAGRTSTALGTQPVISTPKTAAAIDLNPRPGAWRLY